MAQRAPRHLVLRATVGLAILFLWFPLVLIVVYAFTTDEVVPTFPPPGLTTKWFGVARDNPEIWEAMWLSARVAVLATIVALVLGSMTAAAVARARFFGREAISFIILLPIALPGIVTGIALRSGINQLGWGFGTFTIVVGHATFCVVIVYNNVLARLRRTSGSVIEASMDLGASGMQTFRYVLLPSVGTALLAGAMLAFALSFDEIIVTTFTAGSQKTLPIWILGSLNRPRNRPVLNVVAIVVMAVTLIPVMIAQRLAGREATNRL
ncbi:MAG: ABC transporter permease [Acidimicrobiales bacterium]|nr:MAG: ABC transporter permease [Acidimicrobiales bacterium]